MYNFKVRSAEVVVPLGPNVQFPKLWVQNNSWSAHVWAWDAHGHLWRSQAPMWCPWGAHGSSWTPFGYPSGAHRDPLGTQRAREPGQERREGNTTHRRVCLAFLSQLLLSSDFCNATCSNLYTKISVSEVRGRECASQNAHAGKSFLFGCVHDLRSPIWDMFKAKHSLTQVFSLMVLDLNIVWCFLFLVQVQSSRIFFLARISAWEGFLDICLRMRSKRILQGWKRMHKESSEREFLMRSAVFKENFWKVSLNWVLQQSSPSSPKEFS